MYSPAILYIMYIPLHPPLYCSFYTHLLPISKKIFAVSLVVSGKVVPLHSQNGNDSCFLAELLFLRRLGKSSLKDFRRQKL